MKSAKVILLGLVVVLVGAVALTHTFAVRRAQFAVANVPLGIGSLAVPTAVPDATSVSWYCVVPPSLGDLRFDGIILENPTRFDRRLLISSEVGTRVEHGLLLAHSSLRLLVPPGHGRVIVSSGGVVAFMETQTTPTATPQIYPCSSSPSSSWTVEGLSTTTGSHSTIAVYNPFKVQAVVDLNYYSVEGEESVPSVEGLIVRPGAVLTINAGQFAPNTANIAAAIAARSGSIVVASSVAAPNTQETLADATPSGRLYLPYIPLVGTKALSLDLVNTSTVPDPVTISMAGFDGTANAADMGRMRTVERVTVPPQAPLVVNLTSIASAVGTRAVAVKVAGRNALYGIGTVQSTSPTSPFYELKPIYFHSSHWWVSCVANPSTNAPEVVFSRASLASIIGGSLVGGHAQRSTATNILRPSLEPIGLVATTPSLYELQVSHAMTVATLPMVEGCTALPAT
ncbi:DUF5719 family protein [Ferrimicrobium sp.]|uniref:DUF5719 family protein n=1 Tax=Ferrimicrobium sp. TaxID=2926050 RepID=UPI00261348C4|nr:DUF5719 family protein [Ferrimicrobium sp.]